ncbi:hypothetical protein SAMN04515666_101794 [Bosea lupini]|uniref:Uncharacterized protein n=1 Tax=Bosea lupini TaxID=1036779 RepID=A0A1H7HYY8_9HYPH|nr:hypothetical protein [Bosea lupini]SEK54837.1 hypothetical protein SAMN04515666_101794 [Bosea lupini]
MELSELVSQVSDFQQLSPRGRIKIFAWHLHVNAKREIFDNSAIRRCFEELHLADPGVSKYLPRMVSYKELMKAKGGYKLERGVRVDLDKRYGVHHSVVAVSKILTDLPAKIPNINERAFLFEALKCYRAEAFRACIVMVWNLTYAHLLDWILKDPSRLAAFNAAIIKRYPKKVGIIVGSYDNFLDDLKESEVIAICSSAGLFNSNIFKILKDKLDRRNIAAHPSSVVVVQSQADDTVTDLVNNVVLALT